MTDNEQLIYSKLLKNKGKSLRDIAIDVDLKKNHIGAVLSDLKKKGLVSNWTGWRLI